MVRKKKVTVSPIVVNGLHYTKTNVILTVLNLQSFLSITVIPDNQKTKQNKTVCLENIPIPVALKISHDFKACIIV